MIAQERVAELLYGEAGIDHHAIRDDNTARLIVNHGEIVEAHGIDGLEVEAEEIADGVRVHLIVHEGVVIAKPVHMCFGMLPKKGVQNIDMRVDVLHDAGVSVMAHCVFPNAVDVLHQMQAVINVADGARYSYFERHVHSPEGGIRVVPKTQVVVGASARFTTEFELIKGRVGLIDVDIEAEVGPQGVVDMLSRIRGRGDDVIKIREAAFLRGAYARGVLSSKIAVRDRARADIYNEMTGEAPFARGHVDCKEIVQGNAVARAIPIVHVNHPKAHITHEAAIGSVDTKQLETLMSRGLDEEQASEIIIGGLLS